MKQDDLDKLAQLWSNDPTFRQALREDAEAAVTAQGITLDDEDRATLRGFDMANLTDQELETRVSKYIAPC